MYSKTSALTCWIAVAAALYLIGSTMSWAQVQNLEQGAVRKDTPVDTSRPTKCDIAKRFARDDYGVGRCMRLVEGMAIGPAITSCYRRNFSVYIEASKRRRDSRGAGADYRCFKIFAPYPEGEDDPLEMDHPEKKDVF